MFYFGHDYAINSIAQSILFQLYFLPDDQIQHFWFVEQEITRILCVNVHVIPAVPWYFMFSLAADGYYHVLKHTQDATDITKRSPCIWADSFKMTHSTQVFIHSKSVYTYHSTTRIQGSHLLSNTGCQFH